MFLSALTDAASVSPLANSNLAGYLKRCAVRAWLLGMVADFLANNNFASPNLLILQPVGTLSAAGKAACKQHPSGVAPAAGL